MARSHLSGAFTVFWDDVSPQAILYQRLDHSSELHNWISNNHTWSWFFISALIKFRIAARSVEETQCTNHESDMRSTNIRCNGLVQTSGATGWMRCTFHAHWQRTQSMVIKQLDLPDMRRWLVSTKEMPCRFRSKHVADVRTFERSNNFHTFL